MTNLEIAQIYELYVSSSGVCTDTRNILENSMFFALKGEIFNGNDFAPQALAAGAKYVVVDDAAVYARWEQVRTPQLEEKPVAEGEEPQFVEVKAMILVENVLETLQQVARCHRLKFKIPVIALTGTNGKTTTKELISTALAAKYNVVSTSGNLNNHIGVPLTLFRINKETQVAVIEMGASGPGEIELLAKLACPSFGLITNVGKAHLLGFGSFEGVKKTKGELYGDLLEHKKIAFVNVDNPHLMEMVAQHPGLQMVPYGMKNDGARLIRKSGSPYLSICIHNPCLVAVCENLTSEVSEQIALENGITRECCEPAEIPVNTNLIGDYNADNVLAALCIATYFAVPAKDAVAAIERYVPSNNRSQMTKTGRNTLIIDAYNANPTSMRASLENFSRLDMEHKHLILGDMLELGPDSVAEHMEIIRLALSLTPERIFLVGGEFAKGVAELGDLPARVELFESSVLLAQRLKDLQLSGASVLIKGSRGTRLELVFETL